ncbi:hypothetical protein CKM354_000902900 [Cercospora kikuchii]|uniref:F-box domain-containing protein n=1 Tax=Cercospora kikuchii TaxID=84275 RepID=A0A9P3CNJ1_9PEZI|nr:uncharacterized protein CKM354_000902900 [Cercospora kikuchii]GIZ45881.1 hypothetical protein CKM354_000902900 [Cercospora kikuchii]
MAAARVFAIGELLEAILLELPIKDLLLSQRINKDCKRAVDSSTRIRKALFLNPGDAEDTNVETVPPGPDLTPVKPVPVGRLSAQLAEKWGFGEIDAVKKSSLAFNPLIICRLAFTISWVTNTRAYLQLPLLDLPEYASCFRMFITQPPIEFSLTRGVRCHIMRHNESHLRPYTDGSWMLAKTSEGTTPREIVDALRARKNGTHVLDFKVVSLQECELNNFMLGYWPRLDGPRGTLFGTWQTATRSTGQRD